MTRLIGHAASFSQVALQLMWLPALQQLNNNMITKYSYVL